MTREEMKEYYKGILTNQELKSPYVFITCHNCKGTGCSLCDKGYVPGLINPYRFINDIEYEDKKENKSKKSGSLI